MSFMSLVPRSQHLFFLALVAAIAAATFVITMARTPLRMDYRTSKASVNPIMPTYEENSDFPTMDMEHMNVEDTGF